MLLHSCISQSQTFLPLFSTSQTAAAVRLGCSLWKFIYQRHIAKTKPERRSDDFNIGLNQPLAPKEVGRQTLSRLNTWKHIAILFCNGFVIYYTLSFWSWEKEGFSSHWLKALELKMLMNMHASFAHKVVLC